MHDIDTEHFLTDLDALRRIGAFKTGVHRPTYSPQDMESRHWLMARMEEAGLKPEMDGIGNVLGVRPAAGPKLRSAAISGRLAGRGARRGLGRRARPGRRAG